MQISLIQGLLIALVVFICACDKHLEAFMWFRPLVVAFFTGIILGDVQLGLQAGAVTELAYLGLLTVGGTVPPDPLFAGLMTTVLAYTTGQDVNTAMGLAVTFALIGQWIGTATNTFYAGFLPGVDKAAAAGDEKKVGRYVFGSMFLYAGLFAVAAFLSVYALQDGIAAFVNSFPAWLVHGFEVAGGLMPGGRLRMEKLAALITTGRLDTSKMLTHVFHGFDHMEEALLLMKDKPADLIKPVVIID